MRGPRPFALVVVLAIGALGCDEQKPEGPAPSRFASVKKDDASARRAASTFCELSYPRGEGGKAFAPPPERTPPEQPDVVATTGAWRWVNLWATWCRPCVEEMGLLTKWRDSLRKDGVAVDMEMWSVDDSEPKLKEFLTQHNLPGRVHWMRSSEDAGPFFESIGIAKTSAIPVHALVDADNNLRCVRVGSVHEEDYGSVKALLTGS
jgi:thiol-disulfide isomerase/thioredoxin